MLQAIRQEEEFAKRVFAVAFTDSVHNLPLQKSPRSVTRFFQRVSVIIGVHHITYPSNFCLWKIYNSSQH